MTAPEAYARALRRLWAAFARGDRDDIQAAQAAYRAAVEVASREAARRGASSAWGAAKTSAGRVARRAAPGGSRTGGPPPPRRKALPPIIVPPEAFKGPHRSALPMVVPVAAIRDLIDRRATVARDGETVAEVIGREHSFVAARAATVTVAEKVRASIVKAMAEGQTMEVAVRAVAKAGGDWTQAYAETVFRTNATAAYTSGVFATVADPAVRAIIPGVQYQTSHDSDVRSNHAPLDGLAGSIDDPAWLTIAPPNGYRCRCSVVMRDVLWFAERGLVLKSGQIRRIKIPAGGHPDDGFRKGSRPDLIAAMARGMLA